MTGGSIGHTIIVIFASESSGSTSTWPLCSIPQRSKGRKRPNTQVYRTSDPNGCVEQQLPVRNAEDCFGVRNKGSAWHFGGWCLNFGVVCLNFGTWCLNNGDDCGAHGLWSFFENLILPCCLPSNYYWCCIFSCKIHSWLYFATQKDKNTLFFLCFWSQCNENKGKQWKWRKKSEKYHLKTQSQQERQNMNVSGGPDFLAMVAAPREILF